MRSNLNLIKKMNKIRKEKKVGQNKLKNKFKKYS